MVRPQDGRLQRTREGGRDPGSKPAANPVPTAGYTVFDLRGGWRFAGGWEVKVAVENLTDKEYADHLNAKNPFTGERIAEPGRSLVAGLGVGF